MTPLKAPFPWFGGKSRAAHLVWSAFGDVANYVEPFAGSLAVLLARPTPPRVETVNDLDCYLANFWRAVKWAPEEVAEHADWPVNEADLHARHRWLVKQDEFRRRMKHEPKFFDAQIAGWWVWGLCQWIGGGWCSASNWGEGGKKRPRGDQTANEARRPNLFFGNGLHTTKVEDKRPALSCGQGQGVGVNRRHRDLGNAANWEKRPLLDHSRGLLREQIPMLGGDGSGSGRGVHRTGIDQSSGIYDWMQALCERLRRVRVCCGDWKRILGPSPTEKIGVTGVFLDPPYSAAADRDPSLYATEDLEVAHKVREWAIANGDNRRLRIALCGYEGEHDMPKSWQCVVWKAGGGYAASAGNHENAKRERIWFSPHCEQANRQSSLFVEVA